MKSRRLAAAALLASFFPWAAGAQTGTSPQASEQSGYSFICGTNPSPRDWAAELDAIQPANPALRPISPAWGRPRP